MSKKNIDLQIYRIEIWQNSKNILRFDNKYIGNYYDKIVILDQNSIDLKNLDYIRKIILIFIDAEQSIMRLKKILKNYLKC